MHLGEWYRRDPCAHCRGSTEPNGASGTSKGTQERVHLNERSWRVRRQTARDCGGQAEGHDRPRGGNGRPRDIRSVVSQKMGSVNALVGPAREGRDGGGSSWIEVGYEIESR